MQGIVQYIGIQNLIIFIYFLSVPDKPTKSFLSRDLTALNIFERESFFYGGDRLTKAFIDSLICDYGCNRLILPHYSDTLVENEVY